MIVYHGSAERVDHPDVSHSYRALDFGKGFYVTTVYKQALRWARRKADLIGSADAILNVYEMDERFDGLAVKTFADSAEWIDFVCSCRDEGAEYLKYDLIIGRVADDKVFRVVDMYRSGVWDRERAIKEIRTYENYDQIAFITQKAVDRLLTFKSAEAVK